VVRVTSVHSFRGGTGKSNLTANVAVLLAQRGARVGVVDTDVQSPGIHVLFGLRGGDVATALNDFLFEGVPITDVARDVTPEGSNGAIHLIPSSVQPGQITRVLRDGYDARHLVDGLRAFVDRLRLDILLIDTHPGLGEETLLSLTLSDTVLLVLRPDQQDYEGTGVLVEVAAGLAVPRTALVLNKVPSTLDVAGLRDRVAAAYGAEVVGVLPHDDELMTLASADVFALRHPDHALTRGFAAIVDALFVDAAGTAQSARGGPPTAPGDDAGPSNGTSRG
jgi:septum site-determining protein MinD